MSEHVQILSRVEVDDLLVSCSHAVLITQDAKAEGWEVVMLGTSPVDISRLTARCPANQKVTAVTSHGEVLTSEACVTTLNEDAFVSLRGSAPMRRLIA